MISVAKQRVDDTSQHDGDIRQIKGLKFDHKV